MYLRIPRNPFFSKQMVVISGYGSSGFADMERAVVLIDEKLRRSFANGRYISYQRSDMGGHTAIEASNPYFVMRNLNNLAIPLHFSKGVDPHGILFKAAGDTMVHLEDNVVQYFAKEVEIIGNEK